MSTHSKWFAPSSIHRRIACQGSARLEEKVPEPPQSPAAADGTYKHYICEQYFANGIMPNTHLGKEYKGVVCDEQMIEQVDIAIGCTKRLIDDFPNGALEVEVKVDLSHWGYPEAYGTSDVIIDDYLNKQSTLVIADYKFGSVSVDPDNPQMKMYALMACDNVLMDFDQIIMAIIQPTSSTPLKVKKIYPEDLSCWFVKTLEPTLIDIKDGSRHLNPTEEGCRYCKAVNICPAYTEKALAVAQADFKDVAPITPPIINDELVNKAYPNIKLLKSWIKNFEEHAMTMARNGTLEGHKLVNGRSSRKWKDEDKAIKIMSEAGHEAYEKKPLSPAKAEKLGKEVKKAVGELIETIPGKAVIAPIDDKRKAITTAADDFKQVVK